MAGWLSARARGEVLGPAPCVDGDRTPQATWVCSVEPRIRSSTAAAAWLLDPAAYTADSRRVPVFDPARWFAVAEHRRLAAARALPPGATLLRAWACRDRELKACRALAETVSNPNDLRAGGPLWWGLLFGSPKRSLRAFESPKSRATAMDSFAEALEMAEGWRLAAEARMTGLAAQPARVAGLPHILGDGELRAAASVRLRAGSGVRCSEALDLLQRSRDPRQPDRISTRNRPHLFAALARAAMCAGRYSEAVGAARTLAQVFAEAGPAARLVDRVAAAEILRRGATGEQKTNR